MNSTKTPWWAFLLPLPVVWWLALLTAGVWNPGMNLLELLEKLSAALNSPFAIRWTESSVRWMVLFSLGYGIAVLVITSSRKNTRRGEEHGSAKWGDVFQITKRYQEKNPVQNLILTQHFRMGLDGRKHKRNLNVLVIGGSGAGKSRSYAIPNTMQGNCSFVLTDPKGEILRKTGGLLEKLGYEVRVFDLLNPDASFCYNPFSYVQDDKDVLRLMPFRAQEIMQAGGIYYGQNAVSKNMIVADRRKLLNGNSFRLGVSGSGKSFSAKEEIVSIALSTQDDILILDPESEFGFLVEALGGEVIRISAASDTHLNAMDMDRSYGDERNPLIEKSEFILSLFEQLMGAGNVSAREKSILDRCAYEVYRDYMARNFEGEPPTLKNLHEALLRQPEPEAGGLALSSELFITGSLNTFAQQTNVDTKARIIAYDIRELGEQLMPIGMTKIKTVVVHRCLNVLQQVFILLVAHISQTDLMD